MYTPRMVIIEGADFASALSLYLKTCCGFAVVVYDPEHERFVKLLDKVLFDYDRVRLAVCRAHLTAVSKGLISAAYFREFENAVALTNAKLVLAVSESDSANSGILADAYAKSWLDKRTYREGDSITGLLEWLGLQDESRRAEARKDNVRSNGEKLGSGLTIIRQSISNSGEVSQESRTDGSSTLG